MIALTDAANFLNQLLKFDPDLTHKLINSKIAACYHAKKNPKYRTSSNKNNYHVPLMGPVELMNSMFNEPRNIVPLFDDNGTLKKFIIREID
jgi:hypothetical protein